MEKQVVKPLSYAKSGGDTTGQLSRFHVGARDELGYAAFSSRPLNCFAKDAPR